MQELRLVGVQEDGGHLLLSNEAGEEFSLPVTEALRSAATRPIGRPSAQAADAAEGVLTPRDIQARIRGGATAEQVSAESGVALDRVRKYEGPVLAERDWMAHQARRVEVAAPSPGHDLYRSTFGDDPALLGDMVRHRLTALGMDPATAQWDAWRNAGGSWTITLDFSTEGLEGSSSTIGDQPPAQWSFRPSSHHLDNQNRWAQVLSELDPLDGPFGGRRLSAVGDRPFNVEEDVEPDPAAGPGESARDPRVALDQDSQDELLDVLRARRGQRLGVDEEGDDELALMLTRDEQPTQESSRPRLTVAAAPDAEVAGASAEDAEDADSADDGSWTESDGWTAEVVAYSDPAADRFGEHDEAGDGAEGSEGGGEEGSEAEGAEDSDDESPRNLPGQIALDLGESERSSGTDKGRGGPRKASARSAGAKSKRPSVPSWDEIVFGRKGD
ncbi:septation protein SepH [Citricoccus nitrophenolicus]|uniref:septation protein SepH n=1 Tax=Citricoccus nitrophenolicus TaxID=863575 RepID=UPI0039B523B3